MFQLAQSNCIFLRKFTSSSYNNFISYTLNVFYNYMQFNKTEQNLPVLLAVYDLLLAGVQLHFSGHYYVAGINT